MAEWVEKCGVHSFSVADQPELTTYVLEANGGFAPVYNKIRYPEMDTLEIARKYALSLLDSQLLAWGSQVEFAIDPEAQNSLR